MSILMINDKIIDTRDIVEITEKTIHFSIKYTIPNPRRKPKGFFAGLMYSDMVDYYKEEKYFCLVLKVKGDIQMRGQVGFGGNVSMRSSQQYDYYAICNNKRLVELVQNELNEGNTSKVREIGNYYVLPDTLRYPNYPKTNTLVDATIQSKKDFIDKYM